MDVTEEQLELLRSAIVQKQPFCSGALPLSPENFILFYGKDDVAHRIDLSQASDDALKLLSETCDAATFGLNGQDVLDESYRKAGKLDISHFAFNFDVYHSGLINTIREHLLEGTPATRPIRAELYKLNVYGKDSFFRSHKDTPRGSTMFGTLVIVFPTRHEGGALVLRHDEKEWTFDSAEVVSDEPKPSIAYITFYSDVEHEVLPVESGYRVTITYNLHFEKANGSPPRSLPKPIPHALDNEARFMDVLKTLLDDPTFLSDGGRLGFGLHHQYAISQDPSDRELQRLCASLKGSDAVLKAVCDDLSLCAFLELVYINLNNGQEEEEQEAWAQMFDRCITEDEDDDDPSESGIHWVTERTTYNTFETSFPFYGNEPSIGTAYAEICMLVQIGKLGKRASI
ncbi:hypothetical protein A0H81_03403 [Grifola frondosa]|uniref:Fe2OG dioxygenase domain-containing protein n=1 Tax=Grifola frondosa TaxID=5627 RepID=A0A1C7MJG6_GRIFR|nr:hypothetical protein A0H81_03403 [Grifola frondosa]